MIPVIFLNKGLLKVWECYELPGLKFPLLAENCGRKLHPRSLVWSFRVYRVPRDPNTPYLRNIP